MLTGVSGHVLMHERHRPSDVHPLSMTTWDSQSWIAQTGVEREEVPASRSSWEALLQPAARSSKTAPSASTSR